MSDTDEKIFVSSVVKESFRCGYLLPHGFLNAPLTGLAERIGEVGLAARAGYRRIWGGSDTPAPESEGFDPGYEGYTETPDAHAMPPPWDASKDLWKSVQPTTQPVHEFADADFGFGKKYKDDRWADLPENMLVWVIEKMDPPKNDRYLDEAKQRVARAKALLIHRARAEETPF